MKITSIHLRKRASLGRGWMEEKIYKIADVLLKPRIIIPKLKPFCSATRQTKTYIRCSFEYTFVCFVFPCGWKGARSVKRRVLIKSERIWRRGEEGNLINGAEIIRFLATHGGARFYIPWISSYKLPSSCFVIVSYMFSFYRIDIFEFGFHHIEAFDVTTRCVSSEACFQFIFPRAHPHIPQQILRINPFSPLSLSSNLACIHAKIDCLTSSQHAFRGRRKIDYFEVFPNSELIIILGGSSGLA